VRHWLFVCLAACGRFGFDVEHGDGGHSDVSGDDGRHDDGNAACLAGDGVCRVSCLGTDPDCNTTCGDGICVGNAGELCANCADCNTLNPVCGNGYCDSNEDSDTCYADCGPTPWPWTSDEDSFRAMVNSIRTGGYKCPSSSMPTTAPALTRVASMDTAARMYAWAYAYQLLPQADVSCNGRTIQDRFNDAQAPGSGMSVELSQPGFDVAAAFPVFLGPTSCASLMDPTWTRLGVGIAYDQSNAFVVFLN
jgi:hypothetical protein